MLILYTRGGGGYLGPPTPGLSTLGASNSWDDTSNKSSNMIVIVYIF